MALSDKKIAKLAREINELKARQADLKSKADKRQQAIIKEFQRRGTVALETENLRITKVEPKQVEYLIDDLKKELSPARFKKITKPVVDKAKLSQEVQAGRIDGEIIGKCTEIKYKSPYILASEISGE